MITIGAYEAKTHLPALLKRVSKGEAVTITRHGVPVAKIVPIEGEERPDVEALIEEMRRQRRGRRLKGVTIRPLIEEGRCC